MTQFVSAANMVPEQMETVSIDFINENLINLKSGEVYYINRVSFTAGADGIKIQEKWFDRTINIVKAGDMIDTDDSEPQELYIPARPDAPTEVEAKDESAKNKNDGKLLNLNSDMEYQREGADKWISVTGTTAEPLAPGIYIVRIKATKESFCSEGKSYIIRGYELDPDRLYKRNLDRTYSGFSLQDQHIFCKAGSWR